ncbi:phosphatase PAP2 family protein [Simplicispira metamorpha]|uniref:phosphatase PAP2 family protein n=1 Tax=Simplicispira metamorpha TaxID=80881 RepID=UPI0013001B27|nr:phosphatase PAP2 family protein [Simplicispira metamorpha]
MGERTVDDKVLLLLNTSVGHSPALLWGARWVSQELSWLLWGALALSGVAAPGRWRRVAWRALTSMALAWALASAIKALWPVPRPFALGLGTAWVEQAANASFPSVHTSLAFAVALSVWRSGPRSGVALVLLGCALLVAWSRIALGLHFPRDVLAGALLGAACAWACAGRWPAPPADGATAGTEHSTPRG